MAIWKAKAQKREWSRADYISEAREIVVCYGQDYDWTAFVHEYCSSWDNDCALKCPDATLLTAAIAGAVRIAKKSEVDGDLVMDD